MKVNKNDTVLVISGNDKGKKGKILKVFPAKQRIIVEGVHFIKRHTKKSNKNPQGGIVEKEGSINASNVMVICGRCNQPTRIGRKRLEDGKRARVCRKCNEMIPASA
jgi:large subunit ribosomal protein L24